MLMELGVEKVETANGGGHALKLGSELWVYPIWSA